MSTHTRVDIRATDEYGCAFEVCEHETRPCPSTVWDCYIKRKED